MRTRICQHCCNRFEVGIFGRDRTRKYCSETCRKRAERMRARARSRSSEGDDHEH